MARGRVVAAGDVRVRRVVDEEAGRIGAGMLEVEPHRVAERGMAVGGARGVVDARDPVADRREVASGVDLDNGRFGHATRVP